MLTGMLALISLLVRLVACNCVFFLSQSFRLFSNHLFPSESYIELLDIHGFIVNPEDPVVLKLDTCTMEDYEIHKVRIVRCLPFSDHSLMLLNRALSSLLDSTL
jgi:hypothetical protein